MGFDPVRTVLMVPLRELFCGAHWGPILGWDRWGLKDLYGTTPNIKLAPIPSS